MKTTRLFITAMLLIAGTAVQAQMLKCQFKNFNVNANNVSVYYSPESKSIADVPVNVKWAADGTFTLDMDADAADVTIYIGRNNILGAHIQKGKTQEMTITQRADGEYSAEFSGDNAALSAAVCKINEMCDIMRYYPEGNIPPMAESRAKLEPIYKEVLALLKKIKDKNERQEYTLYSDYIYRFMMLRFILDDSHNTKKLVSDYPEYKDALKDIDLNSDMAYRTSLSTMILNTYHKITPAEGADLEPYCRENMDLCDKYVTNSKIRKQIVQDVGVMYFIYGTHSGDYRKFYADATKWAGADAGLLKEYEALMDSWENTQSGTKAFDVTLTDADGNNVQLLDVIKGKFAYIDVWATWCGPCKKEIPHFARLAENYNGKNDIIFISISVDENVQAWKKMIGNEKPSWPQYNINGQVHRTFSDQWGIMGIPRFIMIDKSGNIFKADAPRPSSEEAEKILSDMKQN